MANFIKPYNDDPFVGHLATPITSSAVTRAILQNARKTILVADVSKFELSAPFKISDAKDLDYVILNALPPPTFENSLLKQGTKLIVAREKNARTK